ncbi:hypothetical protein NPIL_444661 [Nephila pilipes]|uniref:Uncharacterized protein n=1 Tax=Nephila pilipes TaxID=299642 RepID=A0A8X6IDX8_NEPPI|nr:hypothetical protein NPIL_444661 [Nephila pilipes]
MLFRIWVIPIINLGEFILEYYPDSLLVNGSEISHTMVNFPGFRNWIQEIGNADESDIDVSDFENGEIDDDVKDPSFAPPDLKYYSHLKNRQMKKNQLFLKFP